MNRDGRVKKDMDIKSALDRMLVLEIVRVTEAAAIAAHRLVGRGDEKAADQAAVDAMRTQLNNLDIEGIIVIGEGERDEAPMLYIGEEVGRGGPKVDIALDPLEGTTIAAKAMQNSLAVIAIGESGTMLRAPDVYMDKIAIGGGYAKDLVDLDKKPRENLEALAKAKELALRICKNAPLSNFAITNSLPRLQDMGYDDGLYFERMVGEYTRSPESIERLRQFLDKTAPRLKMPD